MAIRVLLLASLILVACSTAGIPYKNYVLDLVEYDQGALRGPEPEDDLAVEICKPDEQDLDKCIVLLKAEWDRLQRDYIDLLERLKSCESQ